VSRAARLLSRLEVQGEKKKRTDDGRKLHFCGPRGVITSGPNDLKKKKKVAVPMFRAVAGEPLPVPVYLYQRVGGGEKKKSEVALIPAGQERLGPGFQHVYSCLSPIGKRRKKKKKKRFGPATGLVSVLQAATRGGQETRKE